MGKAIGFHQRAFLVLKTVHSLFKAHFTRASTMNPVPGLEVTIVRKTGGVLTVRLWAQTDPKVKTNKEIRNRNAQRKAE